MLITLCVALYLAAGAVTAGYVVSFDNAADDTDVGTVVLTIALWPFPVLMFAVYGIAKSFGKRRDERERVRKIETDIEAKREKALREL